MSQHEWLPYLVIGTYIRWIVCGVTLLTTFGMELLVTNDMHNVITLIWKEMKFIDKKLEWKMTLLLIWKDDGFDLQVSLISICIFLYLFRPVGVCKTAFLDGYRCIACVFGVFCLGEIWWRPKYWDNSCSIILNNVQN